MERVTIYDTTLRDGCQAEGVAFSVADKLRVAHRLDDVGAAYIEGGWPNETNPRDQEFFQRAADHDWNSARIAAFGSTRRGNVAPEDDSQLQDLVDSKAPVITIFGKAWNFHATDVLRVSLDENLAMIEDSIAYLKTHRDEVIFDAEHFFDGYKADAEYAIEALRAAHRGGADALVLCDTNGGCLPDEITRMVALVTSEFDIPIGIHCHNDGGLAVANSVAAVQAGCSHVQGTVNGYGERAGNANLCVIVPNLELKLGLRCLPEGRLGEIADLSRFTDEVANIAPDGRQPFVGASAFAHKGGMHVNAVLKNPTSFEHIEPELVGNERRILVSDYSGSSTIAHKLQKIWPDIDRKDPIVGAVLERVKHLEKDGYEFEAAEASFELLARRLRENLMPPFETEGYRVNIYKVDENAPPFAEATVKVSVGDKVVHTAGEGAGPINALDNALRKALTELFPKIARMTLTDYKVRVLRADEGTAGTVRVLVETSDGKESWGTVGVHENIIEASWEAIIDSLTYGILKNGVSGGTGHQEA
ncbi:MAG TPA: citramalate synthase [Armatimonadetes bacterium]|jgi:2-isopropylmalate synthase|nr:citramalate synthase [Armatimonadota bacterium]